MNPHFFAYLYRLRFIKRWSLMRNTVEENVAEHSYHVALLTHILCSIGNEVYGKRLSTDRAVSMALFHDATEVFTGDIPTPVKHQNPGILTAFRDIEAFATERLLDMVPPELRNVYDPLLRSKSSAPKAEEELHKLIKGADLLDAYLKCVTELSAGNTEFLVAKKQILESILKLELPEVDYFLDHLAPSLEKTLDELSE